ncbi:hypothetical protein [Tenacibaculum mesophilum]|uniref:hypothetical protein n=1 Tax=Tenacibaculum mesophilum TaxID=104268 RepID=UPI00248FD9FE|nr:hypothetical protein [Tenacibaculum mesophilum]
MEKTISLKEALAIVDAVDEKGRPLPFDITFRTLQRNSKTGGKLYTYNQVVKYRKLKSDNPNYLKQVQTPVKRHRNPNHFANRTRNLELQNGDIKTVHIRLIITVNGLKVIY